MHEIKLPSIKHKYGMVRPKKILITTWGASLCTKNDSDSIYWATDGGIRRSGGERRKREREKQK